MSFDDVAARLRKHAEEKAPKDKEPDFEELHLLRARILGVLIRDARQAANLNPEQCASQIGITPELFTQWELGQAMPSLPQIELLAYLFGVPLSHFWGTETLHQHIKLADFDTGKYIQLRSRLIGALLRTAREKVNLTSEQLAAAAGTSAEQVTAYELGQQLIPTPVLASMASACQVNLSYFLENGNRVGSFLLLQEDLKHFSALPEEVRRFVTAPNNQPYIELAMKLAQLGTGELRGIAESILDITL